MIHLLKLIRYAFWFIHIDPWRLWKFFLLHGPRIQVFRNRRYPKNHPTYPGGARMYTCFRWGGAILGFQFGDRGRQREYVRKQLFGERT